MLLDIDYLQISNFSKNTASYWSIEPSESEREVDEEGPDIAGVDCFSPSMPLNHAIKLRPPPALG